MRILIFAGTTEGRKLVEGLLHRDGLSICVCVATEYGKEILDSDITACENIEIRQGRLQAREMENLMKTGGFAWVIDATHPYATDVTENIRIACQRTNTTYKRLLREKTAFGNDCIFVENTEEAVEYLNTTEGNVLLTTGSKELLKYTKVENFKERLYARVLPMEDVLKSCNEMGFSGKHLICMQGPFSKEMNQAMLKQLECRYMVTKDTGKEGGAYEKYQAAKEAGSTLIVVGRGSVETGLSLEQILEELQVTGKLPVLEDTRADWFPLFINMEHRNIAIIGAGKIAERRIKTLLKFSCNLRIIAKTISEEVKQTCEVSEGRSVELREKEFEAEDIRGAHIVLAATNDWELNKSICEQCRAQGILVNAVNDKEECDFYFPGVVTQGELIVGITAQGKNHKLAKKGTKVIREALEKVEATHE